MITYLGKPAMPDTGVYLGFDFGLRYIGVAVGQVITHSATPLTILKAKDGIPNWEEVDDLITKWHAQGIIVGLPYQLDGSEQAISMTVRKFATDLEERYHLHVFLVDERLTTKEAKIDLKEQPYKKHTKQRVDNYAAKLILESWLRLQ